MLDDKSKCENFNYVFGVNIVGLVKRLKLFVDKHRGCSPRFKMNEARERYVARLPRLLA